MNKNGIMWPAVLFISCYFLMIQISSRLTETPFYQLQFQIRSSSSNSHQLLNWKLCPTELLIIPEEKKESDINFHKNKTKNSPPAISSEFQWNNPIKR